MKKFYRFEKDKIIHRENSNTSLPSAMTSPELRVKRSKKVIRMLLNN